MWNTALPPGVPSSRDKQMFVPVCRQPRQYVTPHENPFPDDIASIAHWPEDFCKKNFSIWKRSIGKGQVEEIGKILEQLLSKKDIQYKTSKGILIKDKFRKWILQKGTLDIVKLALNKGLFRVLHVHEIPRDNPNYRKITCWLKENEPVGAIDEWIESMEL